MCSGTAAHVSFWSEPFTNLTKIKNNKLSCCLATLTCASCIKDDQRCAVVMRTASVKYTDQARLRTDARVLDSLSRVGPRSAVNERARTVLVVRSDLLPYSETFVKQQVLACSRWKP